MQDRPTMKELLDAVQGYFQQQVAPLITDPRAKFQGLIALNVFEILKREIDLGETNSREEWRSLIRLLGRKDMEPASIRELENQIVALNDEFSRKCRAGEFDSADARKRVFEHAKAVVIGKLRITNPGYLTEPAP